MIDVCRRQPAAEGYAPVLTPADGSLRDLTVGRLRLTAASDGYRGCTDGSETVLHVLVGSCTITACGSFGERTFKRLGEREDVFSGLPTTLVLGPNTAYEISEIDRAVDIAVASAPVPPDGREPLLIRPQDVEVHPIGEAHYRRSVREVIGGEGRAKRLRVGETINPTGLWSSWPHHDFDANPDLAPKFEEVFLYFTKPRTGWGMQKRSGLYHDLTEVDDVVVVRNGDAAVLPLGDHPVVAGVDSSVLYVWFYLSPIPKVYSRWAEDVGGYA